ncbi:MAG: helix-turn-helix transcriptional regulator [Cyanobacteria bacterium J06631_2]
MKKPTSKSKIPKVAKLTAVDQDVLTVLKVQGEIYPLEILDCLNLGREENLGSKFSFGSLYPALNRLQKKGLVESRWGDEDEVTGGARRKYYKINALGLRSLDAVSQYRAGLANLLTSKLGS